MFFSVLVYSMPFSGQLSVLGSEGSIVIPPSAPNSPETGAFALPERLEKAANDAADEMIYNTTKAMMADLGI
jgi:hypothetical protein